MWLPAWFCVVVLMASQASTLLGEGLPNTSNTLITARRVELDLAGLVVEKGIGLKDRVALAAANRQWVDAFLMQNQPSQVVPMSEAGGVGVCFSEATRTAASLGGRLPTIWEWLSALESEGIDVRGRNRRYFECNSPVFDGTGRPVVDLTPWKTVDELPQFFHSSIDWVPMQALLPVDPVISATPLNCSDKISGEAPPVLQGLLGEQWEWTSTKLSDLEFPHLDLSQEALAQMKKMRLLVGGSKLSPPLTRGKRRVVAFWSETDPPPPSVGYRVVWEAPLKSND